MNIKFFIIIAFCINIISCSWVSDTWDKRPDWVMPEDEEEKIELVNQQLFSGFNSTCLLYTSPSPRDLSTSRMPSSA